MTDCGPSSAESDRNLAGSIVSILGGGLSWPCQLKVEPAYRGSRTLFTLAGLAISMSGDCTSIASSFIVNPGDFVLVSSCASSSISVLSVPLESTGEGSICCG